MKKYLLIGVIALISIFAGDSSVHGMSLPYVEYTVSFDSDLKLGSGGTDVLLLQNWLEDNNYLKMPVNVAPGYFGRLTQAALIKFQLTQRITPPVGYFGALTRARLNAIIRKVSVKVISPIASERWKIGSTQEVKWEIEGNFPHGTGILISAYGVGDDEGPGSFKIVEFPSVPENNTYRFTVPAQAHTTQSGQLSDIKPGRYKVEVALTDPTPCPADYVAGMCSGFMAWADSQTIRIVR